MRFILGSQSPRRAEILGFFSLPFEQIPSDFDEKQISFHGDPIQYAKTLSLAKANSLFSYYPSAVILTADTVVYKDGKIFNKPLSDEENYLMLKELNGSWHSVFTSLTATAPNGQATLCQETRIEFQKLNDEELRLYHCAFGGLDMAGGYHIQMGGGVIVKQMEGCFYNVMGLPLGGLQSVLKGIGISLWHYLPS